MAYRLNKEKGTFEEVPEISESVVEKAVFRESGDMSIVPERVGSAPMQDEPTESFRRLSDLSVFQIVDKDTGKVMGIISGYALQIKFNREAITSTADVEQCAEGVKKLFYNIIMDQLLGGV